ASPGQDSDHAGAGRGPGRAAAVRGARGRRRQHRRHPAGTGRGRDQRGRGPRTRRDEGRDRPGQRTAGADQRPGKLAPWQVTLAPVLRPRDVAAWPEPWPWPWPGAVLSPAGALASLVTGRCPAQPPRCDIVVVLTTAK